MQPFDYAIPVDYVEASALLAGTKGAALAIQGGTDLLIRLRAGSTRPPLVVDLKHLPGMTRIHREEDRWLSLGAACTLNQITSSPAVAAGYDLLAQACNAVASYQIRNRATIGGNCCNGSPAADTLPALYCLDAEAEIYGPEGTRRVSIERFLVSPGHTVMRPGEFMTSIWLPPSPPGAIGVYNKLGRTKMGDIALVNVAAYAWPDATPGDNHLGSGAWQWRVAMGAVGPTPLRALEAEELLCSDRSSTGIASAARSAAAACRPIDDIRAGALYRRAMVEVLTRRAIETVVQRMGGVS